MKINAIIESKDGGTLVLDFPQNIYDVYEKLQSVGIRQSPRKITLSDEDGDDVRVKLYSADEVGKHLILTLSEQDSLADANMLAFMVNNAKPDFRPNATLREVPLILLIGYQVLNWDFFEMDIRYK